MDWCARPALTSATRSAAISPIGTAWRTRSIGLAIALATPTILPADRRGIGRRLSQPAGTSSSGPSLAGFPTAWSTG